jgi:sigma-B regulation protein RsbU (phosphoserine phosphatase)
MKDKDGNITNFVSVIKDITELKEKQEQEFRLNIAGEIQKRLNEPTITLPGFDVEGANFSAVETSGDFFDYITFPDGQIGLVLGDVCGHGVGSALIMAETRAYIRAFAKTNSNPEVILQLLNKELATDLDGFHYVTLIIVRLNPQTKVFDYASAGHIPCYVLNRSGQVEHELASTGIPLGYIHDYEYSKSEPIKLNQENIIFLLTDGITEAQSIDEIEFGYEGAINSIRNNHQKTSKEILEQLYQDVLTFTNNQPIKDDITSIICKVNGEN